MGFRYHKRINLGDGVGINVSKSGVSTSVRTKYGTIGSKGFSIRTGIPGLTWRSGFGGKNTFPILLVVMLILGGLLVAYNLIRFAIYLIGMTWGFIFTENGFSLRNFSIVVLGIGCLSTAIYFYANRAGAEDPTPPTPIEIAPIQTPDTTNTEAPKEVKPKKRRERKKTDSPVKTNETPPATTPETEPALTDPAIELQTPTEAPPTQVQDISEPEKNQPSAVPDESPAPDEMLVESEKKKAKWYQFKKRRAEKKQDQLEVQPE